MNSMHQKKEINNEFITRRKRAVQFALPFLVLPFITLGFWALGGGKIEVKNSNTGINAQLPSPSLKKETGEGKLRFYQSQKADSDQSEKLEEQWSFKKDSAEKDNVTSTRTTESIPSWPAQHQKTEQDILSKMALIDQQIKNGEKQANTRNDYPSYRANSSIHPINSLPSTAVPEFTIHEEKDSEILALNQLMDKILRVQQLQQAPVQAGYFKPNSKGWVQADPVFTNRDLILVNIDTVSEQGFYSETSIHRIQACSAITLKAQEIRPGDRVIFRLLNAIPLKEGILQEGVELSGVVKQNSDRFLIEINSVWHQGQLMPLHLQVFDTDGQEGIHVQGQVKTDTQQELLDHTVQSVDLASLDPTFKTQLASQGTNMLRQLLKKPSKAPSIILPKGYLVYLQ